MAQRDVKERNRRPVPSTGGTAEPNDQPYGDVFFDPTGVNPFVDTEDDHLSTFGLEVDTGSLVSIITGLRLGIGYSWRALVGGEMLSALVEWGIGKMVYQARFWNDVLVMLIGLLIIGFSGFLLDRVLLKWLERETVEKWGMLAKR